MKFRILRENLHHRVLQTAATAITLSTESTMSRTFHRVVAALFFYMVKRAAATTFTSFLPKSP